MKHFKMQKQLKSLWKIIQHSVRNKRKNKKNQRKITLTSKINKPIKNNKIKIKLSSWEMTIVCLSHAQKSKNKIKWKIKRKWKKWKVQENIREIIKKRK